MDRLLRLDDLLEERNLLIDTCALIAPIRLYSGKKNKNGNESSVDFYKKRIIQSGRKIYVTESVVDQYLSVDAPQKRRLLIESIQANDGILRFSYEESELYRQLEKCYDRFKHMYHLEDTDYRLVISAITEAELRDSFFLVSNDNNLLKVLLTISCFEGVSHDRLEGVRRPLFNGFQKDTVH